MHNHVLNQRATFVPHEGVGTRPVAIGCGPFRVAHRECVGGDLGIGLPHRLAVMEARFAVAIDGKIAGGVIQRHDIELARGVDVQVKRRFVTEPRQDHLGIAGHTLLNPAE